MDDYDQFDSNYHNFDDMDEYGPPPPPMLHRNDRYNNAFGNYRGGYGPGGDYGPPRFRPPFPPPCPGPMFGQGYGPRGPPRHLPRVEIEKTYRYLIRCGVPKESLKNLPNDFYNIVTPQHCGLCGMDFPDFNMSRVHYSSKNHMKSQKKWLSKRTDNPHRAKEAPLKSRELYCELCDVQITSKVHAESHYLGKPHRAIVEGRKVAKNPVLLQRNMSARLEQLIRREKKALKNIEDKRPAVETLKEEENKAMDPELYCDICKTSVTCSEQMTMHLNGKKHLAKEKRHIFDMMKGNPDNGGAAEDAAAEDAAAEDAAAEDAAAEDTAADDVSGNEPQQPTEDCSGGNGEQSEAADEPWTEEWNENEGAVQ